MEPGQEQGDRGSESELKGATLGPIRKKKSYRKKTCVVDFGERVDLTVLTIVPPLSVLVSKILQ